jgi:plastocyanin
MLYCDSIVYPGKAIFTILALATLAILVAGCSSPTATQTVTPTAAPTAAPSATPATTAQPAPQSASVTVQNFAFNPQVVKIAAGGSVTWTNLDGTTHTVTFGDSSQNINNGASYTKKFDAPGKYSYHCSIHPSMTGTVEVT